MSEEILFLHSWWGGEGGAWAIKVEAFGLSNCDLILFFSR
jgi:hypothetical protein